MYVYVCVVVRSMSNALCVFQKVILEHSFPGILKHFLKILLSLIVLFVSAIKEVISVELAVAVARIINAIIHERWSRVRRVELRHRHVFFWFRWFDRFGWLLNL